MRIFQSMDLIHFGNRRNHVCAFGFSFGRHRFSPPAYRNYTENVERSLNSLQLVKQFAGRILVVELPEFAHDLAASFVVQRWYYHGDGDNLVTSLPGPLRILDSALAHAQFLAALGTGRNLQLRTPIDGQHIDLDSKRSFRHGHRYSDVNIVANTAEYRVSARSYDEK